MKSFRSCSMARHEEEKERSVQTVRERSSTTSNTATGQEMRLFKQILLGDDLIQLLPDLTHIRLIFEDNVQGIANHFRGQVFDLKCNQ